MRALVAAVYLIALQSKLHAKTTPNTVMRALMHDLGLSKQEIENEMDYVHRRSRGTNWFEVSTLKKLRLVDGPSKKRARITQTRMVRLPYHCSFERRSMNNTIQSYLGLLIVVDGQ